MLNLLLLLFTLLFIVNNLKGNGRYNIKDNQRFITIARGSLYETIHWLRLACYRKLINSEKVNKIKPIIDKLSPKLNAYLKSFNKKSLDRP